MKVREIAFNIVCQVVMDKKYVNLALRSIDQKLSDADRSLLVKIVYGTIRNYDYLKYQWSCYIKKKIDTKKVEILLNMATYQILFLEKVPDYAAVNEIVEISKKIKNASFTPLINAVLRKVVSNGKREIQIEDPLEKLSIQYSMPLWLVKLFNGQYGYDKCVQICQDSSLEAKVYVRCNTLKTTVEQLLKDEKFSLNQIDGCLYYDGNILETDYYKNNLVYIQNAASQIAVNTLAPKDNDTVLDMCAAPGSKSIQMGMMMHNSGHIVSCDIHPHRVNLIKENVLKYGLENIECIACDSTTYTSQPFDCVLLDAPCSGLGTLRHKPDIKLTIKDTDLDNLVVLQKQLLDNAKNLVKVNGYLLYSTCTINKKENGKQIERFIKENPNYKIIEERQIWHSDYDCDGFYVCKMVREW